jgi:hypothetical protein
MLETNRSPEILSVNDVSQDDDQSTDWSLPWSVLIHRLGRNERTRKIFN